MVDLGRVVAKAAAYAALSLSVVLKDVAVQGSACGTEGCKTYIYNGNCNGDLEVSLTYPDASCQGNNLIKYNCYNSTDSDGPVVTCADDGYVYLKNITCPGGCNSESCSCDPVSIGGDPHFKTWDGEDFSFHGKCDLVLVHSPGFGKGLGLDAHIRTEHSSPFAYMKHVALRIGKDILEVVSNGELGKPSDASYLINGVLRTELSANFAGYRLTKNERNMCNNRDIEKARKYMKLGCPTLTVFKLDIGNDEYIRVSNWKGYSYVDFFVNPNMNNFSDAVGLMGTWGKPGKIGRNGVTDLEDANAFGQEWQVLDTEPKLFRDDRHPQHPETCLPVPLVDTHRRLDTDLQLRREAEGACAQVNGAGKNFCVSYVMSTGDVDLAAFLYEY